MWVCTCPLVGSSSFAELGWRSAPATAGSIAAAEKSSPAATYGSTKNLSPPTSQLQVSRGGDLSGTDLLGVLQHEWWTPPATGLESVTQQQAVGGRTPTTMTSAAAAQVTVRLAQVPTGRNTIRSRTAGVNPNALPSNSRAMRAQDYISSTNAMLGRFKPGLRMIWSPAQHLLAQMLRPMPLRCPTDSRHYPSAKPR